MMHASSAISAHFRAKKNDLRRINQINFMSLSGITHTRERDKKKAHADVI